MNERPSRRRAAKPSRRVRHHREPDERADESWRPLAGWGAPYDVSDQGRVRKPAVEVGRRRGGAQHYRAQLLRPFLRNGSPVVQLAVRPQRHRAVRVARLVAEAFLPPRPPGAVLVFRNGDPGDVRAANLAWSAPAAPFMQPATHAAQSTQPTKRLFPLHVPR